MVETQKALLYNQYWKQAIYKLWTLKACRGDVALMSHKRSYHFPRAWELISGSACSGSCCLGCASGYFSTWHKGAGVDICVWCTGNHKISILNVVRKSGQSFSSWHPHRSWEHPRWWISFRVFSTSYYQCCWTGWRGAWSLD